MHTPEDTFDILVVKQIPNKKQNTSNTKYKNHYAQYSLPSYSL